VRSAPGEEERTGACARLVLIDATSI
jgi:hypothetical protein